MMDQARIDFLQQEWLISKAQGRCLHIGSGMKPIIGAVNLDPNPERRPWADVAGNALALPFADGAFDTVVSSHVLPVFADIHQALLEMARVLVPGGRMAHVVPDLRYAPSRKSSHHHFERQANGWYGPSDFRQSLHGLADVLIVTNLVEFTEFQWSFKFEALRMGGE